jgi:hypothetical protein
VSRRAVSRHTHFVIGPAAKRTRRRKHLAPPWERCQQWRTNLEAPRLDFRDLAPTEIRALENYGVVRLEPDELSGSYVRVDD